MSVVKSKRKESQFEVFHHFYKMRRDITDLLLRDFGFDLERAYSAMFTQLKSHIVERFMAALDENL